MGKPGKERGRDEDILGPGRPYSIALRLRALSNKGLIVTLLLYSTVQVILEEFIDTFLVSPREARLLLCRHSEPELTSVLEVWRMMRKRGRGFWGWGEREDGCSEGMSELAPILEGPKPAESAIAVVQLGTFCIAHDFGQAPIQTSWKCPSRVAFILPTIASYALEPMDITNSRIDMQR